MDNIARINREEIEKKLNYEKRLENIRYKLEKRLEKKLKNTDINFNSQKEFFALGLHEDSKDIHLLSFREKDYKIRFIVGDIGNPSAKIYEQEIKVGDY